MAWLLILYYSAINLQRIIWFHIMERMTPSSLPTRPQPFLWRVSYTVSHDTSRHIYDTDAVKII